MTALKLIRNGRASVRLITGGLVTGLLCLTLALPALSDATADLYRQTRATADGIGKSYMGREIAQVMGWQGAQWLEREEREREKSAAICCCANSH